MKYAFLDPTTNLLVAHGFVEANRPQDIRVEVDDSFDKTPGEWEYREGKWLPVKREMLK